MTPDEHNLLVSIAKDVAGLKTDVETLKADVQELKLLKVDVAELKAEVQELKSLKVDVQELKADVQELKLLKVDVQDIKNYLVEKEQEFYDKSSILFDARQINVEKIKENTNNIKSIQNILGKHAIRISKLESLSN